MTNSDSRDSELVTEQRRHDFDCEDIYNTLSKAWRTPQKKDREKVRAGGSGEVVCMLTSRDGTGVLSLKAARTTGTRSAQDWTGQSTLAMEERDSSGGRICP